MNDNLRDAAFRAGVWQFIEQRAKAMKDDAKAELAQLEPGDAVSGKWHGQPVAKATMTAGRNRVEVTDHESYVEWVAQRWPSEIVYDIRDSFHNRLLKEAIQKGALIDEDGEVCPFVEVSTGSPYVTVRKSDGAEAIIAELFRTGSVGLEGIKAAPLPPIVDPAHLDELPVTRWVEDMEAGAIG